MAALSNLMEDGGKARPGRQVTMYCVLCAANFTFQRDAHVVMFCRLLSREDDEKEQTVTSSAKRKILQLSETTFGRSLIKKENKRGPRTLPYGTPDATTLAADENPLTTTD